MFNTLERTGATEYLMLQTRCHTNWCCYNWVWLYFHWSKAVTVFPKYRINNKIQKVQGVIKLNIPLNSYIYTTDVISICGVISCWTEHKRTLLWLLKTSAARCRQSWESIVITFLE